VRSRLVIIALTLPLIALVGCGFEKDTGGPPSHPGNLEGPRSLLIRNSDIEEAGATSPYGVVLGWWQALQRENVDGVKRSYGGRISTRQAKREIRDFAPRFSQPVEPEVEAQHHHARLDTVVRSAVRLGDIPTVVSIRDVPVSFALERRHHRWELRAGAFSRYRKARLDSLIGTV
jgi:hypothetical protein